jgi:hypothetical protein
MQITPNEIDTIEEAGHLHNSPVKMIRTKGGFWIAVGKLRGKKTEEALAAGSHPAIVKFNIEKAFPEFQPAMMKSEHFSDNSLVEKHSHFLSDELRKSGHDIYSVQDGINVDFHVTRHNMKVSTVNGILKEGALVLRELKLAKEFARALAGATTEKALSCNASKIRVGDK